MEPTNRCLLLEGVTREGVLGWEGVGSNATNPVESETDGLGGVPSKGTNPVEPEADELGLTGYSALKSAKVLVAHSLTLGSGC